MSTAKKLEQAEALSDLALDAGLRRGSESAANIFSREAKRLRDEATRIDAERYRFLRSQPCEGGPWGIPRIAVPESETRGEFVNEADADAAIDAAMQLSANAQGERRP